MRCRPLWRCCKRQQQPGVSILTVPVLLPIAARQGVAREAVLVRESGRLRPATDLKLAIDVRQVVLDRLLAEPEVRGDLFVRAARRDLFQDLALATCQAELVGRALGDS